MWALLRQLDFYGQELRLIDADLARVALVCENTKRLMCQGPAKDVGGSPLKNVGQGGV